MYKKGKGVPKDYKEAVKWFKLAAKKGNVSAQNNLGVMYKKGKGVLKDYKESVKWFKLASKERHAKSQYDLGIMYRDGLGVIQYDKESIWWIKKSAEKGFPEAQNNLGERYSEGKGFTQDNEEAIKWFKLATKQKFPEAEYNLSKIYLKEANQISDSFIKKEDSQDNKEKKNYIEGVIEKFISETNTENSTKEIKTYYLNTLRSSVKNLIVSSSKQGFDKSQFVLGLMYKNGEGVPQDYKEAVKWYRKAAKQGNFEAQYSLGEIYQEGKGIPQDYTESVKWYRLAAEQGYSEAQSNLGDMYRNGQGVSQDYKESDKWYRLAAEQGNFEAQRSLGIMYKNGVGVPQEENVSKEEIELDDDQKSEMEKKKQDYKESIKWFTKSAEQGDSKSQYNLGEIYQEGKVVPKNMVKAYMFFNLAAVNGDEVKIKSRNKVAIKMTPSQVEKSQDMAREWIRSHKQIEKYYF
ncbi:MAG: sel1 repeat family protein, partial [Methylococcales bacterium]|nr:sel1 repeat family protein [Methylococcales bacterium]